MLNSKSYTVDEAKVVLEKYCVYQDRCHQEVMLKLRKMGMISDAQDFIVLHLLQHNFLNEERFAKHFVSGKFNQKKWGRVKIKNALKFKGISSYNIKTALLELNDVNYLETLTILATKKAVLIKGKNPFEKRKKLSNYLQTKGYELNIIIDVISPFFNNELI